MAAGKLIKRGPDPGARNRMLLMRMLLQRRKAAVWRFLRLKDIERTAGEQD
jgi:hypothetical protein